jgi:DnaJ domain
MESPTHYELLCVSPTATADEIRAAYRRLIRMYHPDVAGAAGAAMTLRLNAAQSALLDPTARSQYDRARTHAAPAQHPHPHAQHSAQRPRERPRESAPPRQPNAPFTTARPATPQRSTARLERVERTPLEQVWFGLMITSIGVIVAGTAIAFAYAYAGPLTLTTPRLIPPVVIALAWLAAGINKPPKIVVALLVIAAALWPLSVSGIGPFAIIGLMLPDYILIIMTVVAFAVVTLRVSAPIALTVRYRRPVTEHARAGVR